MDFKEKVKYVRMKLYLSQETLAEELGITFATVNRWETGKHLPTLEMQRKFYDYCKKNDIQFEEKE